MPRATIGCGPELKLKGDEGRICREYRGSEMDFAFYHKDCGAWRCRFCAGPSLEGSGQQCRLNPGRVSKARHTGYRTQ